MIVINVIVNIKTKDVIVNSGTKKNMYERILQANAKIKDYNFGDLLAKMQSENPEIQEVACYNFLVSSKELIKSYLSREDIANLFEIDKNNYNSLSSKYSNEYKSINTLPDNVEDVLQQFYAKIPSIENLDENIIYEFAKTAFWSNKATKICGQSIGTIILDSFDVLYNDNEENRNKVLDNSNEWVKDLYNKYSTLKEIKEKRKQLSISIDQESNEFKQKRKLLERQENVIKNEIISNVKSIFENYYLKICKGDYQAEKDFYTNYKFFEEPFKKYSNIKQAQKMNYFIKSVSIRQLFKLLVKDNYNKYKDWGFYNDVKQNGRKKGKIFAFAYPGEKTGIFTMHLEQDGDKIVDFESDKFDFDFKSSNLIKGLDKHITFLGETNTTKEMQDKINELDSEIEKYLASVANGFAVTNRVPNSIPSSQQQRNLSKAERTIKSLITDYLNNSSIPHILALQQGENLDIHACMYAMQKYAYEQCGYTSSENISDENLNNLINKHKINPKTLYILRIPAGQIKEGALNIDAGKLKGVIIPEINGNTTIQINANEDLGEKSACSILSRLGIYVPQPIIKYSDIVPSKEEILEPRNGLIIARELQGEELFKFAEAKRGGKDGPSLLEVNLTDEEINNFNCKKIYEDRVKEIKQNKADIELYGETLPDGRKIVFSPKYINKGSFYAYALGYDIYVSVTPPYNESGKGSSFCITANPEYNNGQLDKKLCDAFSHLRILNGDGIFIKDDNSMIIAGGPKNKKFSLYPNWESKDAQVFTMCEIKNALGCYNDEGIFEKQMQDIALEIDPGNVFRKKQVDFTSKEKGGDLDDR